MADLKILGLALNEMRGHVSGKVAGLLHSDASYLVLATFCRGTLSELVLDDWTQRWHCPHIYADGVR